MRVSMWWYGPLLGSALGVWGCAGAGVPVESRVSADPAAISEPLAYRVYVANESSDLVSRVRFVPGEGAVVENQIPVGIMPADNDGAHGISVSPDGRFWYLTVAHGTPYGTLWKFHAGPDTLVGRTVLGLFPATMGLTPDGQFLAAVNFNLHGDMVPSDVSIVFTPTMTELTKVTTCLMPHGSRVDASGSKHYSACMHSDQLVEIDLTAFSVSARFSLIPGSEGLLRETAAEHGDHSVPASSEGAVVCSPTWAEPGEAERAHLVYVACNKNREILEVDTREWRVTRRLATGSAPYNLDISADGSRLVATLKGEQGIAVFDLESGLETGRIATTRPVTHGVVLSPDGRFAFVSNESIGSVPGTLDVFDLDAMERVASVQLAHQSGGIGFWAMTPVSVGVPTRPAGAIPPPVR